MPNVSALSDSSSISQAWLAAAKHLKSQKGRACYNLIYAITSPGDKTPEDEALYKRYDIFSEQCGMGSTTTVANTIFPLDTYLTYGGSNFYEEYTSRIYPQVKTAWGTYFDRMIRRRDRTGKPFQNSQGTPLNPLDLLVNKLRKRAKSGLGTKSHYELALADEGFELTTYLPEKDPGHQRGGPCLSHISFKIDDLGALRLTAFYRSHFYVERALGNLLGLARLQAFAAQEAQMPIGPLTCIASYAYLETNVEGAPPGAVTQFLTDSGL
jgi:hypothetical protein